jgi:hypothetical protein
MKGIARQSRSAVAELSYVVGRDLRHMAIGKGPLMLSAFTVSLRSATKILD